MTSRVFLDLPYWAMCTASYRLIRMAIEMPAKEVYCFAIINLLSCITVVRRPCYGQLKIKPSYTIVSYYALI